MGTYQKNDAARTLTEHWNGTLWSFVESPNLDAPDGISEYLNTLQSVACISTADCWAVGEAYYYNLSNGSTQQFTVTEHWDGSTWTLVTSPNTNSSATDLDYLYGVSCVSSSDCWAAGAYTNNPVGGTYQTLIEHYDGTSWTIATSANSGTTTNFLSSITCPSATECWAVGYNLDTTGELTLTLIEEWNGTAWSIVTSANASLINELEGVSCASATDCQAVGYSSNEIYGFQTLFEHWNGTSWSVEVTSPDVMTQDVLDSVYCNTASDCWAVGDSENESGAVPGLTLIEHYDGTSWSAVTSLSPGATDNLLFGVACTSTTQCLAVGNEEISSVSDTYGLIEQWNGTAWSTATAATIAVPVSDLLSGIACVSVTDCWAVGAYPGKSGLDQTLIEQWNGTAWSIVASPNDGTDILSGIACSSASECWAVGFLYTSSGVNQTLIETWDGTSWSVVSSPNSSATLNNLLYGVTCVSATNCWAVGYSETSSSIAQTLIEQWNGTSWSIVTSADTSTLMNNELTEVSCASATECWAVGYSSNGTADQTLIEEWNGNAWSIVPSPDTLTTNANILSGVSCATANECWAVGYGYINSSIPQVLIEQWDGQSWSIFNTPESSPTLKNYLDAVTCASASDCRAVGGALSSDGSTLLTVIEQWDGTSWTIVNSSGPSASPESDLYAVACVSSANCWTAGSYYNTSDGVDQTLIEQDDTNVAAGGVSGGTTSGTSSGGTTTAGTSGSTAGGSSSGGSSGGGTAGASTGGTTSGSTTGGATSSGTTSGSSSGGTSTGGSTTSGMGGSSGGGTTSGSSSGGTTSSGTTSGSTAGGTSSGGSTTGSTGSASGGGTTSGTVSGGTTTAGTTSGSGSGTTSGSSGGGSTGSTPTSGAATAPTAPEGSGGAMGLDLLPALFILGWMRRRQNFRL